MYRTTARVTGGLFITATAAGVLSAALLDRSAGGSALMVLVMGAAIVMIPPVLFPVLKVHGEALAVAYVAARTVEVVLLVPATQPDFDYAPHALFFCLSALLLNVLLYRSRLVPRWISGWALVAVVPYLVDAVLVLLGVLTPTSTVHGLLVAPLGLNEMVLAVWLLTKGFRAQPAGEPLREHASAGR
ncbi:DUF4386 family protein [Dactylosporangium sp. NPDC005555]|uniref:DUF4386 family protein n=1 Tax=Dactylosporangium sp. NPDC005555 TaxID=3154889 RepID=UPI0033B1AE8D